MSLASKCVDMVTFSKTLDIAYVIVEDCTVMLLLLLVTKLSLPLMMNIGREIIAPRKVGTKITRGIQGVSIDLTLLCFIWLRLIIGKTLNTNNIRLFTFPFHTFGFCSKNFILRSVLTVMN